MQSAVENQQHVMVEVGSEGGTVTQGYSNFADGMSPEGAATYANSIGGTIM